MKKFYTADQHFYHKNIIRFCNWEFKSLKEMHSTLISNWNSVVSPQDTVYALGDFAMVGTNGYERVRAINNRLNGKKVLILGNHDEIKPFRYLEAGFSSVHTSLEVTDWGLNKEYRLHLFHDPCMRCVVPENEIFVCGHTHNLFKSIREKGTVNVSVENWNYTPVTLQQILDELNGVNDGKNERLVG